jgi:hypothetical protein
MLIALSLSLAILAAPAAPPAETGTKETFGDALKAANDSLGTPEGKAYDSLAKYSEQYIQAAQTCMGTSKSHDTTPFQTLLKVGADGVVTTTLTKPETDVSACFAGNAKKIT